MKEHGHPHSGFKVAFGSIRVMPTCTVIGQGAGIGAAMAAKQGILPKDVDVLTIRDQLLKGHAVLEVPPIPDSPQV